MTCRNMPLGSLLATRLSSAEIEAAALHLSACSDCRERMRVMTAIKAVFKQRPQRDVEPPARSSSVQWLSLGLLAAALLLCLLPLIHLHRLDRESVGEMATSKAYPAFPLQTRSAASSAVREKAVRAYRTGRYNEAAALFSRFAADAEARFYEGVSCYFLGRTKQALEALEAARRLDPAWRTPALWYQANTLLKANQIEDARRLLERLTARDNDFSPAAKRLLRRLDKIGDPASR